MIFGGLLALLAINQVAGQIKRLDGSVISQRQLTARLQQIVDSAKIIGLSVLIMNDGRLPARKHSHRAYEQ
jgi:hypothetical protein